MNPSVNQTTCAYCGVGCGVSLPRTNSRAIKVKGDINHPANHGKLCIKGSHLGDVLPLRKRLLFPSVSGQRASWQQATSVIAAKIQQAQQTYGPDSVAFYLSGQLLTEDYYAANKLAKGFLGTANVDTNSRLCMSSAVAAHTRAFGEDLVPGCYDDIDQTDLLVVTGSNLAWAHPILFQRFIHARKQDPNKKLIVIDPRTTATAKEADLHLAIDPGADGQLFNALLVYLANNDVLDRTFIMDHVDNFDQTLAMAAEDVGSGIESWSLATGLPAEQLRLFLSLFAQTSKTTTLWSMGINQSVSGVDKGNAIINVHLATGRIGKPGATAFSITGQPNAMGGREVGGLANQLAIHRGFDDESVQQIGEFWQAQHMATKPGLKATELFDACLSGDIKVLWIMATNPLASLPDANKVAAALANVDCVIVSDVVNDNDTLSYADICLPAQAWGEKDGTVTNSERTISRQRAFLMSPGQARADWQAIADVAKALGFTDQFNWHHAHEIFREHARLSRLNQSTPLKFCLSDVADLSFREYQDWSPQQWPLDGRSHNRRLFSDGQFATVNGKAQMIPIRAAKPAPATQRFLLNTGRLRDQWHTMTRTSLASKLRQHSPDFELHIEPDDAKRHNISNGDLLQVSNEQGAFYALARLETAQHSGQLFAPMHWNRQFASHGGVANVIANITDPISGQPASKHSWVSVKKCASQRQGFLFLRDDAPIPDWFSDLISFCQPTEMGQLYRIYQPTQAPLSLDARITAAFGKVAEQPEGSALRYRFDDSGLLTWCLLADTMPLRPEPEFLDYAAHTPLTEVDSEALESGQATPGSLPGKIICSCFSVTDQQITGFLADNPEASIETLQQALKCGTNCGSCLSEVKDILADSAIDLAYPA